MEADSNILKFDIREFHTQVLMSGALPLSVLERKVDAWIKVRKAVGGVW